MKDVGKEEQLSICLRYVDCGVLNEDFYNLVKADGLDSRSVMAVLKGQLDGMGMDSASHLIAQFYDGASVMSGRLGGLQALMRNSICPLAIYVHCWAHRLTSLSFLAYTASTKLQVSLRICRRSTNYSLPVCLMTISTLRTRTYVR